MSEVQAANKRGPRAVLNLREDFEFTEWLHEREPKWGESPQDVYHEAIAALPALNGKLNVDHVRTRLNAFADKLPKAKPPVTERTLIERIEVLERGLAIFARSVVCQESISGPERAWLMDYLTTTGL